MAVAAMTPIDLRDGDTGYGEEGDDTFSLRFDGSGTADGGPGNDTLDLGFGWTVDLVMAEARGPSSGSLYNVARFENVTVHAQSGYATIVSGNSLGNDLLINPSFNDGTVGVQFSGLGGDDTLQSSNGGDMLDGGTGADTASYALAPSAVRVNLNIQGVAQNTLGGGFDTLTSIESASGSAFNDFLFGTNGSNTLLGEAGDDLLIARDGDDILFGGAGNDRLLGQNGNDFMAGGAGDDLFFITGLGDQAQENANEGLDEVRSLVDFTLGDNIENLRIQLNAINGTGNELDNLIIANGEMNVLNGMGGNDNLQGGSNVDTLHGGTGNDSLFGGQGNDILNGGDDNDTLRGQANSDTLNGDDGNDLLFGEDGQDTLNGGGGQ